MPWLGGRKVHKRGRTWRVTGELPREFGWYEFELTGGRTASSWVHCHPDADYANGRVLTKGYVIGDRFIPENARVDPDPNKFVDQTVPIFLVETGLDRFSFVQGAFDEEHRLIYTQQLFPQPMDEQARWAFVERKESLGDIKGVTPALDLAFRFAYQQRKLLEERRAELEQQRLERERAEEARRNMGTGLGRRTLARQDFEAAAKAALKVSGAEYLDSRPGYTREEMVVQYRFENRRLECVVNCHTLRVIDSGICLTSSSTGEKGDTYFTLESLPAVVRQAIQLHKLVIYRHVDGDLADDDRDNEED